MSTLRLETENNRTNYMPGEELKGIAMWQMDKRPRDIEVRIFWYTEGKGTQDVEIVDTIRLESPKQNDVCNFEFTLPQGPHSFSGSLISLLWAIEVVAEPSGDTERLSFNLSSTGEEIQIICHEDDEDYPEDEEALILEEGYNEGEG